MTGTPTKDDKSTGKTGDGKPAPDDRTKDTTKDSKTKTKDSTDTGDGSKRTPSDCAGATPTTTDTASGSGTDDDGDVAMSAATFASAPGRIVSTFVPRKRRGAELFLLVLALIVGVSSYALVGLGRDGEVPTDIIEYGGFMVLAGVVCHIAVRFLAPYADPVLLPAVVALNGIGLAMIRRIDLGSDTSLAGQQIIWAGLSVAGFCGTLALVRDHRRLQAFTYTFGFVGIGLLVLPLLPVIGTSINGARIWVHLGSLSFQPGEIAKICLAIFFAGYLVVKRDALALAGRRFIGIDLPRGRDLGPILLMWVVSLGVLVFQRDLGSSLLFFGLFVVLLYVATERPSWLAVGGLLFLAGAYIAYLLFGHVQARIDDWLDPDPRGQIMHGQYGLAWGGILGRGWGQGAPYLTPFSYSDFIATSLGEELGLTGLMAIIVIYGHHRRARLPHVAGLPRPVRQAAGRRPVDRDGAAGVRRDRRRHTPDPADRSHHAVPVVRRVVARRQLDHHRAAAAHQ